MKKLLLILIIFIVSIQIGLAATDTLSVPCTPSSGYSSCKERTYTDYGMTSYTKLQTSSSGTYVSSGGNFYWTTTPMKIRCDGTELKVFDLNSGNVACTVDGCSGGNGFILPINTDNNFYPSNNYKSVKLAIYCSSRQQNSQATILSSTAEHWVSTVYTPDNKCYKDADCTASSYCKFENSYISSCQPVICRTELGEILQNHACTVPNFPVLCTQAGIKDIFACQQYINEYIPLLQGNLDSKVTQINQLNFNLEEKINIIKGLTADINTQADLIKKLSNISSEQAVMIKTLQTDIVKQADLIKAMQLTQLQQEQIVKDLSLKISEQATMINELTTNLQIKIAFVNSLQVENEKQAELIKEMRVSFANQAVIIDGLNNTIQDDAVIIKNLGLNLQEQGELISQLKLTNQEKAKLIEELTSNLADQQKIIDSLTVSNSQKQAIIDNLNTSLVAEQQKVTAIQLLAAKDKQVLTEFYNTQINKYKYLAIGSVILVIIGVLYLLLRKKRR